LCTTCCTRCSHAVATQAVTRESMLGAAASGDSTLYNTCRWWPSCEILPTASDRRARSACVRTGTVRFKTCNLHACYLLPTSNIFSARLPHSTTCTIKGGPGSGCWQALETRYAPQRCGAFVCQHQPLQSAAAQQQSGQSGKLVVHLQHRKIHMSRCCTTCACIDLLARAGGLCQAQHSVRCSTCGPVQYGSCTSWCNMRWSYPALTTAGFFRAGAAV